MQIRKFPRISVLILTYNGMDWFDSCFRSVLETDYPNFDVVVIDNNSSDGGPAHLRKNFPEVHVLENHKNRGTAAGYNAGIKYALERGAEYVAMLNQDIKVTENWLRMMVQAAEQDAAIGVLSPLQYDYEEKDLDPYFQKIMKKTSYFDDVGTNTVKKVYYTLWAIGASMCVKREVFEKIGLFDPFYFMYEDDADFCRRAACRGFKIAYITGSQVFHYHTSFNKEPRPEMKYLQIRNKLLFLLKDPRKSFVFNFCNAFIWTDWNNLFSECHSAFFMKVKTFLFLTAFLPLIYAKYLLERKTACYGRGIV